jgi:hypothetical protein
VRRWSSTVAGTVLVLATAGCGSTQDAVARDTAMEFERALSSGGAARACDLLAPRTKSELVESAGKPCPQALTEEDLPEVGDVRATESFGTMAQVRFDGDVLFLAEFRGGWKVMAAGCTDRPEQPYNCLVGG